MMKFAVLSLVLAVAGSAPVEQSHGATSFVSLSLGGKAGYTQHGAYETTHQYQTPQVYHATPQYHAAAPVYVQKYVAPVVAKVPIAYKHVEEEYGPAEYEFKYAVEDKHTGDVKSQHETRHGDQVQGEYSFHEADGTIRSVKYTVDKHSGFNAVVERSGHAAHPQSQAKAVYTSAPVAHGYYH